MYPAIRLEHDCTAGPEDGCAACNEFGTYGQGLDEGADALISDRLVKNLEDGAIVLLGVSVLVAFVWNAI